MHCVDDIFWTTILYIYRNFVVSMLHVCSYGNSTCRKAMPCPLPWLLEHNHYGLVWSLEFPRLFLTQCCVGIWMKQLPFFQFFSWYVFSVVIIHRWSAWRLETKTIISWPLTKLHEWPLTFDPDDDQGQGCSVEHVVNIKS
jgi:hypothetical protein